MGMKAARPHHWESLRETIADVIDALPSGSFRSALLRADSANHPRTVLRRWACALGRRHFGDDPDRVLGYAAAVLSGESTFVFERDAGMNREPLTEYEREVLEAMESKARIMRGGAE